MTVEPDVSCKSQTASPGVRAAVVVAERVAVRVPAGPDTMAQLNVAKIAVDAVVERIWDA